MKGFTDWVTSGPEETNEQEQITEATMAHKAQVYLKDGKIDEVDVVIVNKSSGGAPNVEIKLNTKGDTTINMSSGYFDVSDTSKITKMLEESEKMGGEVAKAISNLYGKSDLDAKKVKDTLKKAKITKVSVS